MKVRARTHTIKLPMEFKNIPSTKEFREIFSFYLKLRNVESVGEHKALDGTFTSDQYEDIAKLLKTSKSTLERKYLPKLVEYNLITSFKKRSKNNKTGFSIIGLEKVCKALNYQKYNNKENLKFYAYDKLDFSYVNSVNSEELYINEVIKQYRNRFEYQVKKGNIKGHNSNSASLKNDGIFKITLRKLEIITGIDYTKISKKIKSLEYKGYLNVDRNYTIDTVTGEISYQCNGYSWASTSSVLKSKGRGKTNKEKSSTRKRRKTPKLIFNDTIGQWIMENKSKFIYEGFLNSYYSDRKIPAKMYKGILNKVIKSGNGNKMIPPTMAKFIGVKNVNRSVYQRGFGFTGSSYSIPTFFFSNEDQRRLVYNYLNADRIMEENGQRLIEELKAKGINIEENKMTFT